jgi:antitoxin (DNA-binding transcriptional repressor) of toxin-antitoxin stability system
MWPGPRVQARLSWLNGGENNARSRRLRGEEQACRLLDLVERGEEIIIKRHGKEVARLVPPQKSVGRDQARAPIRRIRERAEKLKAGPFEWAEWKSYRDEGRP